ncbi:MAG TPA: type II toxin-antitoxin system HicB family antitoxin, partial [Dehalococcoidia bacterium]|nr:type II toxin-antitoxin system HicB family antitoxin [Dehalococcoidia bacterium]
PDLPGVVATGATREEVEREIGEAIAFHLEGMAEDHEEIPEGTAYAIDVEVGLPHTAKKVG